MVGRSRVITTIDLSGPFFQRDPVKTFRANVREMMDAVAAEGEADAKAQLRAGEGSRAPISAGVSPARVSGHVRGRTRALSGRRWAVTAVVSINNRGLSRRQGIALMAAAARVESQTHAFRRTTSRIRRSRAVNQAELFKGLQ